MTLITLTRHSDGASITLPVLTGPILANVGDYKRIVDAPCLTAGSYARAKQFLGGIDVEQRMHAMYVNDGIIESDADDYSYTLA